jgi:hypothetical protein
MYVGMYIVLKFLKKYKVINMYMYKLYIIKKI